MDNNYYFKIAIKTARDLRKQLEERNKLYREGLEDFKCGKTISWQIGSPIYDPINIQCQQNLITLSSEINDADIKLRLPRFKSNIINAYFKKYEVEGEKDRVEIVVTEYNFCWTRYLICKELLHLYIYTPEAATASIGDLNLLISHLLKIALNDEDVNEQVAAEHAAYYGAVELLIPTEIVPALRSAKEELEKISEYASTANLEIAKKLGVPESLVEFRLMESVDKIFEDID